MLITVDYGSDSESPEERDRLLALFGPGPYGLWDTKDKLWIGDGHGPYLYTVLYTARLAATLYNDRFASVARIMPKTFKDEEVVLKDRITPPHSIDDVMEKYQ